MFISHFTPRRGGITISLLGTEVGLFIDHFLELKLEKDTDEEYTLDDNNNEIAHVAVYFYLLWKLRHLGSYELQVILNSFIKPLNIPLGPNSLTMVFLL